MKSLPVILGIFVVVLFGLLLAGMFLWTPLRVHYYFGRYEKEKGKAREAALQKLLEIGWDKIPDAKREAVIKTQYGIAKEHVGNKEYDMTLAVGERIIKLAPEAWDGWHICGVAYSRKEEYPKTAETSAAAPGRTEKRIRKGSTE